jgi:pentatricopeptide repeat protein
LVIDSVLVGFANKGSINQTNQYFQQMQIEGFKPDLFTYECLLKAYSKQGDETQIKNILELVKKKFVHFRLVTLTDEQKQNYANY